MDPGGDLLSGHDLLLLDLDGVVYVGGEAVGGAVSALAEVRRRGVPIAFATNNASRTPDQVAEHLVALGVDAAPDEVVTSSMAAAAVVVERLGAGARVLPVGGPGVRLACESAGLVPVDGADDGPAAVVQGYGPDIAWRDLAEVAYAVRGGAWWVATNTDATLPTERGPAPGNGSLVAAVRHAVEVDPTVAGKPEPALFQQAAARVGADDPLVVGDRLDTDVAGARAAGFRSVLVLTGVSGVDDLLRCPAPQRPDVVVSDLRALHAPVPAVRTGDRTVSCGGWTVRLSPHREVQARHEGGRAGADAEGRVDLLRAVTELCWGVVDAGDRLPAVPDDVRSSLPGRPQAS
ncbi:HAD-IIA family hydrolase [Thalassiella azotivora]